MTDTAPSALQLPRAYKSPMEALRLTLEDHDRFKDEQSYLDHEHQDIHEEMLKILSYAEDGYLNGGGNSAPYTDAYIEEMRQRLIEYTNDYADKYALDITKHPHYDDPTGSTGLWVLIREVLERAKDHRRDETLSYSDHLFLGRVDIGDWELLRFYTDADLRRILNDTLEKLKAAG